MIFRKTLNFGGVPFQVETADFAELYKLTTHLDEINLRVYLLGFGQKIKNLRWVLREVDGNEFHELWGTLDDKRVRLKISKFQTVPRGLESLPYYIDHNARFETYDRETEKTFVYEGKGEAAPGWVESEWLGKKGWSHLATEEPKTTRKRSTK